MNTNLKQNLWTSESVGKGHPDKICDQIADKILDAVLAQDVNSRSAIEVLASNRLIVIAGELSTNAYVDVVKLAWDVILPLGYTTNDFTIISNLNEQSPDISQAVNKQNQDIGAGDQGIVYGFACDESAQYMPLAIQIAHRLVEKAEGLRISDPKLGIKADMKSQVAIGWRGSNGSLTKSIAFVDHVLMSIQHEDKIDLEQFKINIKQLIIAPVIKEFTNQDLHDYQVYINPSGRFVIGGPIGDTGLTGRKIIVDTYGGAAKHGGGAFSGKDYTKVDRCAAYAARWVAKNLVAAGVAAKIEIQIAYAIGISQPIAINVNHFGTSHYHEAQIVQIINQVFDLSPRGIIDALDLKRAIYGQCAVYGHFGKPWLPWEQLNRVHQIKAAIKQIGTNLTTREDLIFSNQPIRSQVNQEQLEPPKPVVRPTTISVHNASLQEQVLATISATRIVWPNQNVWTNHKFTIKYCQSVINQNRNLKVTNAFKKIKNLLKIAHKQNQPYQIRKRRDLFALRVVLATIKNH